MKKILAIFIALCSIAFATSCKPEEKLDYSLDKTTWIDPGVLKIEFTRTEFTSTDLKDKEVATGPYTYKNFTLTLMVDGKVSGTGTVDGKTMILRNPKGGIEATCTKQ